MKYANPRKGIAFLGVYTVDAFSFLCYTQNTHDAAACKGEMPVKKMLFLLLLALLVILAACACSAAPDAAKEAVPVDYSSVVELAKKEFAAVFSEFEGLEITNTSTSARTDDCDHVIVQIAYTANQADGVYGFEFRKDKAGNIERLQQGEDITTDLFVQ